MDKLELFLSRIQGPSVISTIHFKQKWGVQRKTTQYYVELRLARLEHNNQPWKKAWKLGQNSAYLTHWHNGRIIMEYLLCPNNHLFVAYAAPKKIAKNSDFIRLLGQKPIR